MQASNTIGDGADRLVEAYLLHKASGCLLNMQATRNADAAGSGLFPIDCREKLNR